MMKVEKIARNDLLRNRQGKNVTDIRSHPTLIDYIWTLKAAGYTTGTDHSGISDRWKMRDRER